MRKSTRKIICADSQKELLLRFANINDSEQLAQLDQYCFAIPWSKQSFFSDLKNDENNVYLVIEEQKEIIAYGGFHKIIDEAEVMNIAVSPAWRKKGLASLILFEMIEAAKKMKLNKISLEVRSKNLAAQKLYLKFGFEKIGLRNAYYADDKDDAIIMLKNIN